MTGLPRGSINKTTFPLSEPLANKLAAISQEVHSGKGVANLRGLDAAKFNDEEAVIAFAGICSYAAHLRASDSFANQAMSHIRDATHDVVPAYARDIGLAGSKITSAMVGNHTFSAARKSLMSLTGISQRPFLRRHPRSSCEE